MAIKVGDTIYILHYWTGGGLVQRTMVVNKVSRQPTGRYKTTNLFYHGTTVSGCVDTTWHSGYINNKPRSIVRKTPHPGVPFKER